MALCGGQPHAVPICVIFVMYFFVNSNITLGTENLIYTKLCYQIYHDFSLCSNQTFVKTHPDIQKDAARWFTYSTAVQLVPAIVSNIVLSSYCDLVAHKLPMVLTVMGALLQAAWLSVCSHPHFVNWPVISILLASLISGICGSYALMIMAGFSYISAITAEKNRSVRFAILESSVYMGMIVAQLTQGPFITNLGMFTYFLTTAALSLLPIIIVTLFMNDVHKSGYGTTTIWELFTWKIIFEAATAMFRYRPNGARSRTHLSLAIFFTSFWGVTSIGTTAYLYLTKEIGLSLDQYSLLTGVALGARTIVPPLTLLLCKRVLKMSFLPIVMLGSASFAIALISFSLPANSVSVIIGYAFASLQPIVFALTRNYQSSIIPPGDVGKLFAYEGVLQVFFGLIGSLFSRTLYMLTLEWWPGTVYAVSSVVAIISMVLVIILEKYNRPNGNHRAVNDSCEGLASSEEDLRQH